MRPLIGLVLLGLVGCAVEEPSALPPTGNDPNTGGSTTDFRPPPPADMARPDDGRVEPPSLGAIRQLTEYPTVPIHGTAEAGATVLIKATDGSQIAADVLPSGRFCADVPLKPNSVNRFELRVVDLDGNMSSAVSVQVEQRGTPTVETPQQRPAENMSIGGAVATKLSWDHGSDTSLKDGDAGTYAGAWQRAWATTDSVVLRLAQRRSINKITLRAPSECPLTAHFQLFVSNADAPSDPGTVPMQWTMLRDATAGIGQELSINLQQATILSHVAVYFDRGWVAWGDADINCGNWAWGAYYAFSEIQAWSVPNAIPPPPPPQDLCGGGSI
jgi:hypothetical protein